MEDAVQELYTRAKSSKLATTILLLNLCTVHGVSNCFVDELFSILHAHLLLDGNSLPKNHYAARTLTKKLGLAYTSIHACESRCVLFRGEYANETTCPKCGSSRFKDQERKKFPVKVLRHFPVIPRLQRLFRSPTISRLMRWHSENRSDRDRGDNLVRHPCDSKAWRHFHDNVDPTFREDARNVHFALATDGMNPFKQTRSTWSMWPVMLLNYNLPPWLCTKKFFVLLALLIPGKESVTSEVFDVYLEPLIEELLQLWYGIPAYDITKEPTLQTFTLRAVLLWTIHDFLGYGTMGGFSHQGYAACPWCGPDLGADLRNIRRHLWLTTNRRGKMMKPQASYVLSAAEFEVFAQTLESVKMPTGYSSNLGKHIRGKKFGALKLHDYHVLMQQLLPLTLRDLLKPNARMAVMRVCKIYRRICTKVYNPADFDSLELDVAESMALLEMEFPPSFFDIMTNLPYHLVQELDLCGPVSTRWMYPVERYMKTLKGYVRNMARTEHVTAGSIHG
jgi:hypothetical protein